MHWLQPPIPQISGTVAEEMSSAGQLTWQNWQGCYNQNRVSIAKPRSVVPRNEGECGIADSNTLLSGGNLHLLGFPQLH
jgi:hypothetical protein